MSDLNCALEVFSHWALSSLAPLKEVGDVPLVHVNFVPTKPKSISPS